MARVVHDPDCKDCNTHEMGICWTHKIGHMRANGSRAVRVPSAFKNEMTNNEIKADIYDAARKSGREITRYKG